MASSTTVKTIRKRVRKACLHCKRAKTSCSEQRPCTRCVRLNSTCIDAPSTSSVEDKELWEETLRSFVESKAKRLTVSERNIVSRTLSLSKAPSSTIEASSKYVELKQKYDTLVLQLSQQGAIDTICGLANRTNRAVSRWGYTTLTLMDYSEKFKELLNIPTQTKEIIFSLNNVLHKTSLQEFQTNLVPLMADSKIIGVDVKQIWLINEEQKEILSHIQLIFNQAGDPSHFLMISSPMARKLNCPTSMSEPPTTMPTICIPKQPIPPQHSHNCSYSRNPQNYLPFSPLEQQEPNSQTLPPISTIFSQMG